MKAKVTISKEIDFDEIVIENYTLSEILHIIEVYTTKCLQDISIERQKEIQNLTDIDAPLYHILNLIERIQGLKI
ncbi:hypothetical protein M0Q97_03370 [Candidatus Dojkabacteria bacterium]|jgi:hypothetical protein|nr:hypothetical protein [Candidatus Dojkabacteria bacterium]